jgi:rhodanese-related sulfurtransferase
MNDSDRVKAIQTMLPEEVKKAMEDKQIVLVDVREPAEFAAERIHGALLFPLSTFDPAALPADVDRTVVFHCGSGKRSADAIERCRRAGLPHNVHMDGGLMGWKAAKLPTITLDVATGAVRDRR